MAHLVSAAIARNSGRPLPDYAANRQIRWGRFVDLCARHAVEPLAAAALRRDWAWPLPQAVRQTLVASAERIALRNMFLTAALRHALDHLSVQAINALVLKGPALTVRAYGSLALRHFTDLDLLVAPGQILEAVRALADLGYRPVLAETRRDLLLHLKRWRQIQLKHPASAILIDLHSELLRAGFEVSNAAHHAAFEFQQLWSGKTTVRVSDMTLPTLSDQAMLLYLCVHGAKHRWAQLSWVADLAALMTARQYRWDALLDWSARLGATRRTRLGMALAAELLSISGAQAGGIALPADKAVRKLCQRVWQGMATGSSRAASRFESVRFVFLTGDRVSESLRTTLSFLFVPTLLDCQWLPPWLHYWWPATAARLVRITVSYIAGGMGMLAKFCRRCFHQLQG